MAHTEYSGATATSFPYSLSLPRVGRRGPWERGWYNSSTTRSTIPVNTMRKSHNHTLSRYWYDYPQPRIIFSRLTQAKYHQITRKNSAYWQITPLDFYLTLVLFKFPDVRSHGRQTSIDPVCSPNSLDPDKSSVAILLSPNSCYSLKLIPGTKALVFTLEKRTISYLSVSARIRVIDPFSQMKREYNTILDDADSANRNNFVPSQSFTWCSPGNVSQGHQWRNVNCSMAPNQLYERTDYK